MNRFLPFLLIAALLFGCKKHTQKQPHPRLPIEVAQARWDSIPTRMSFVGYLAANYYAVIQPRVSGYLASKCYDDGMPVGRGQLLFTIDPNLLSTTMLAAEATLESAQAQLIEARNNYERAVPLAQIDAISQSQLDQYTAQYKATEASVRSAEQALLNARLNVGYAELRSPIAGIAATTNAQVGDYVGPGTQFSTLTTVSNTDTLTVDVSIPMAEYLRYGGSPTSIYDNANLLSNIRLNLADGSQYPYPGAYDYTRRDVSGKSGTIVVVVMFPNPKQALKPGQFAHIEATVGAVRPRIVVPQQCISQVQGVNSVWVIGADSTAMWRQVSLGDTYGGLWCIDQGVAAGEWVAVTGQQKLHNGAKVALRKK